MTYDDNNVFFYVPLLWTNDKKYHSSSSADNETMHSDQQVLLLFHACACSMSSPSSNIRSLVLLGFWLGFARCLDIPVLHVAVGLLAIGSGGSLLFLPGNTSSMPWVHLQVNPITVYIIIIIILRLKFSLALFPAGQAQCACSHTCTYTIYIYWYISCNHLLHMTYFINYINIKQVLVELQTK